MAYEKSPSLHFTITDLHILAIIINGGRKYGLEILEELKKHKVHVSLGSIYSFLRRLEKNDLIVSEWGEKSEIPQRGGHRRKYFKTTETGIKAFEDAKANLKPIFSGSEMAYGW